ncbi:MAG: DsbA family protein [bacterium]
MCEKAEERPVLYLVHDPMCSWCWAFRPIWEQIQTYLPASLRVELVLGGLAPDTDEPMPDSMQQSIAGIWRSIEWQVPGTKFNHAFWQECQPRRSTYPANRAVLCAAAQGLEEEMILAIQQAYYLQAQNPSEIDVLIRLAGQMGMDVDDMADCLESAEIQRALEQKIAFARSLGGYQFPSLFLKHGDHVWPIEVNYVDHAPILETINFLLTASRK